MKPATVTTPNILLIYTDQQRADSLGCYGSSWAVSPHIDQLASQGARLDQFHVNSPVCMPSRMSFLSGRTCSSTGVGWNGYELPADVIPLNQILSAHGFRTAQFGKLHFQPHSHRDHKLPPKNFGFDPFILSDEPGCYDDAYIDWLQNRAPDQVPLCRSALPPSALAAGVSPSYKAPPGNVHQPYLFAGREDLTHSAFVSDQTCLFLDQAMPCQPFFAIAGFYAPHAPLNPPKRFLDLFDPATMRLPVLGPGEKMLPFLATLGESDWREIARHYYALCAHVDECVGHILAALERNGLSKNTVVVFTSDHGEFLGDHGRVQKGMPGHDCISRVPFIVRHPSLVPAGIQRRGLAEGVDFVATVLDWCGVPQPAAVQGHSMRSWLAGGADRHRDSVLMEAFESDSSHAEATVKTPEWTYYQNAITGVELLYNRFNNPEENEDRSSNPADAGTLATMRALLSRRLQLARIKALPKLADY